MPFALIALGLVLVITAAQDTYAQLGKEIRSDLTGQGSFTNWAAAIGMAGALGYVEPLRRLSWSLMGLVLLVLLLKHSDFFAKFNAGIKAGPKAPAKPATNEPSVAGQANKDLMANNKGFGLGASLGDWVTSVLPSGTAAKTANDNLMNNNKGFDVGTTVSKLLPFLF